jgi:hypothetical protein
LLIRALIALLILVGSALPAAAAAPTQISSVVGSGLAWDTHYPGPSCPFRIELHGGRGRMTYASRRFHFSFRSTRITRVRDESFPNDATRTAVFWGYGLMNGRRVRFYTRAVDGSADASSPADGLTFFIRTLRGSQLYEGGGALPTGAITVR